MKKILITVLLVLLCSISFVCRGAMLQPGNKAPELDVAKWLRNGPVSLEKPDDLAHDIIYVIEFWGTWSQQSVEFIPHLKYLQKKFEKNGLVIVAISKESEAKVTEFLQKYPDLNYSIGLDNNSKTSKAYMDIMTLLPKLFIVDSKQKILWDGEVFDLESALNKIFEGKFDLDEQKKISVYRKEMQVSMQTGADESVWALSDKILDLDPRNSFGLRARLFHHEKKGQIDEPIKFLERRIKKDPDYHHLYFIKMELLTRKKAPPEEFSKLAEEMLRRFNKNPDIMNELAWNLLDTVPFGAVSPEIAFRASEKAVEGLAGMQEKDNLKEASFYNTFARACYSIGLLEKAYSMQEKVCGLIKTAPAEETKKAEAVLNFYKKALELNKNPGPVKKTVGPSPEPAVAPEH